VDLRVRTAGLRLASVLLFFLLAGCSAFAPDSLPCPAVAVLPDAAKLVRYAGGTDLIDVEYEATIESVTPVCRRSGDDFKIELRVAIAARRGPAMQDDRAAFAYFVAVTSADRQVLAREEFPVVIPLSAEGRRIRLAEQVEPKLPIRKGLSQSSYRIYVGMVLTRQQIRQNRGG